MSWTGNVEENFKIWFQKFELYFVTTEKTSKLNIIKCILFLHIIGKKTTDVYNALLFT